MIDETDGEQWILSLRIPGWCAGAQLAVNGQPLPAPGEGRYAAVERAWRPGDMVELNLPMAPRFIRPHPYMGDLRGCVAIERGPLVYCFEAVDQEAGLDLRHISLSTEAGLQANWQDELLEGAVTVTTAGVLSDLSNWTNQIYRPQEPARSPQRPIHLIAVPYFAWANRGAGAMRVWVPSED